MADVGLGRADEQRLIAILAESGRGGLDLDGIAEGRAGAVRLQVIDISGGHTGAVQRLGDDALLGDAVGNGQAARGTVLVDRATADHGPDPVTVAHRVLKTLDHDDAASLATDISVGRRVERLALAVRCEHA